MALQIAFIWNRSMANISFEEKYQVERSSKLQLKITFIILFILLILNIFPVLKFSFAPLVDWPNHLARHVLEARWFSNQPLPTGYTIKYTIIPNLGSDCIVPFLIMVFGWKSSSKIFLIIAISLMSVGATWYISAAARSPLQRNFALIVFFPWLLSGAFIWGFLNYYSSVGVAFFAMSHLQHIYKKPDSGAFGYILHAAILCILFFWHLAGIMTYVVLFGCWVLADFVNNPRRRLIALAARHALPALTLVPVFLLLLWIKLNPQGDALANGHAKWSSIPAKGKLFISFFSSYRSEYAAASLILFAIGALLIFRLNRKIDILCDFHFISFIAFLVLFLIMPDKLGSTSGVDARLLSPAFIALCAFLSKSELRKYAQAGAVLIMLAAFVRYADTNHEWMLFDRQAQTVTDIFSRMPPGQRVLVWHTGAGQRTMPQSHFADYGVAANNATATDLFAIPGQQPLQVSAEALAYNHLPTQISLADKFAIQQHYDLVWTFDPEHTLPAMPSDWPVLGQFGPGTLRRTTLISKAPTG